MTEDPRIGAHGRRLRGFMPLVVLCVILTLGLWPFHVPENQVTWLADQNGLRFGGDGTAFSSSPLRATSGPVESYGSLEIWLQPLSMWKSGTFLTFYVDQDPFALSLRQSQTELELRTAIPSDSRSARCATLLVSRAFYRRGPSFLSVTSGQGGTVIYVDGVPVKRARELELSMKEFTGRLVLGTSAKQTDSWSGQVFGSAVYHRELSALEVREHYAAWTQHGRPAIREDERNVALYLFGEGGGNVVHNQVKSGADLYIPKKYVVLDQVLLESPWSELDRPGNFWGAVHKNVVGFIPFGFCFYLYLSTARTLKQAALVTVILGALVSLAIEILQAYLPTRSSGVTDVITNTLGTCLGVGLCQLLGPIWPRVGIIIVRALDSTLKSLGYRTS